MKVGIITIYDNNNYGNKLQNYALQNVLENLLNAKVETFKNNNILASKTFNDYLFTRSYSRSIAALIKDKILKIGNTTSRDLRTNNILKFDKLINKSEINISKRNYNKILKEYDYFVIGSDQIWNPHYVVNFDFNFLTFIPKEKKITYAASYGINNFSDKVINFYRKSISDFDNTKLSFRENQGKIFTEKLLGKEVGVVLDPTMLIDIEHWETLIKEPEIKPKKKYILTYILGNLSDKRKSIINRLINENGYELVEMMNKEGEYYSSGVGNFLWLIKNSSIVLTDSFHCGVFSILFNKRFYIFDREGSVYSMNSRFETLLGHFNLKDRFIKDNYDDIYKDRQINYKEVNSILENKKNDSMNFLVNALRNN